MRRITILLVTRRERGTRRRRSRVLTCSQQAVFGLRWFRENRQVTTSPRKIGAIVKAALALIHLHCRRV